jgi:hypothetical protein
MKTFNKSTILAVAIGLVAAFQTAQASLTSSTLASLSDGGSLSVGDKTFTGFSYLASGLTSFNAAEIVVTASIGNDGVYYLTWGGNMGYSSSSLQASSADLLLKYIVTANAGQIDMIDQSYTGGTENGSINVTETVRANVNGLGNEIVATSHLTTTLNSEFVGPNLYVNPAQTTLYVTKDIYFTVYGKGYASVSEVSQSFHQTAVPEPSTVVAGALLLLPFGVSTLRILRKNKAQ